MAETWYRYEDYLEGTGYTDVSGEYVHTGSRVRVRCWSLKLIKRTPKGVVVEPPEGGRRFIADRWHRKYACPTRELAVESFVARKMRQAEIYEARALDARKAAADVVTSKPTQTLFAGLEMVS